MAKLVVSEALEIGRPLGRREYVLLGASLMALKYVVDAISIRVATGFAWTPIDYLWSLVSLRGSKVAAFPSDLSIFLLLWTLPFIWIGVVLSVRRAQDAGLPPWIVVFFFLPLLNYVLMLTLALVPAAESPAPADAEYEAGRRQSRRSTSLGALAGAIAAMVTVLIGIGAIRTYGLTLFLGAPFMVGAVSAFVANRIHPREARATAIVVMLSLALVGGALLLMAIEGVICIAMAAPPAIVLALLGGAVGRGAARFGRPSGVSLTTIVLLLPAGASIDQVLDTPVPRVVLSSVVVDATPSRVWRHVVAFDEIREAPAWYFRTGLAYPLRARIEGRGVGAVRTCEFTTGAFREPITAWEEPSRLAFDVADQPAPLHEWSPYSRVYAPHLAGYFRATRGEFRLVALPGGRTRLEGRTWYTLQLYPTLYWTPVAEMILHRIHDRVLLHIKEHAELP
jgi:hypothetical protein